MRLIDAERLSDLIKNTPAPRGEDAMKIVNWYVGLVESQPTVDPVKHGRWIYKPYVHACSVCGSLAYSTASSDLLFDYCPYCGAKMDEVTE